jgi:hypothetical protein
MALGPGLEPQPGGRMAPESSAPKQSHPLHVIPNILKF